MVLRRDPDLRFWFPSHGNVHSVKLCMEKRKRNDWVCGTGLTAERRQSFPYRSSSKKWEWYMPSKDSLDHTFDASLPVTGTTYRMT